MKSMFPEFFTPTPDEFKAKWQECHFSFDANVLLNLYRFSDGLRNDLLEVLTKLKERSWLTHQAALEYFRGRAGAILNQVIAHDKLAALTEDAIKKIPDQFKRGKHFIETDLSSSIDARLKGIVYDLEKSKQEHLELLYKDTIRDFLVTNFDTRVGPQYSPEERDKWVKEAQKRKASKIPPGFKDENPGDVLIWFQLIAYAKEHKKPIILVTDDGKEDWWDRPSGRTIGPRSELVREFLDEAKVWFYMYSTDTFLQRAKEYLSVKVADKSIEEAKEIKKQDEDFNKLAEEVFGFLKGQPGALETTMGEAAGLYSAKATNPPTRPLLVIDPSKRAEYVSIIEDAYGDPKRRADYLSDVFNAYSMVYSDPTTVATERMKALFRSVDDAKRTLNTIMGDPGKLFSDVDEAQKNLKALGDAADALKRLTKPDANDKGNPPGQP